MEIEQFDTLTRQVSGAGSSRRQTLRAFAGVLLGGALGGVAARLGLAEVAEAKGKKHKAKPKQKRHSQAERQGPGQLQAEGKRKGKRKKKKDPPPLPPECRNCNDCQMCKDGACYRDPALEGVRCLGSGSNCGYCQGGLCTATDRQPCEDGVCPLHGQCCTEEQRCPGGECVPWDDCCPGRKPCGNGFCIPEDSCCHHDIPPSCGECERLFCEDGKYVCQPRADRKLCPDGSCVLLDDCCLSDQPQCGTCEVLACENGGSFCKKLMQECPGGEWDPEHCRCKYCEEKCDPNTGMCHSTCPDGHRCEEGKCHRICESPIRPQLCCVEEFPGQVRCACRWINEICYAFGGIVVCVPGQTCCPPDAVRAGVCPQACREAGICQP